MEGPEPHVGLIGGLDFLGAGGLIAGAKYAASCTVPAEAEVDAVPGLPPVELGADVGVTDGLCDGDDDGDGDGVGVGDELGVGVAVGVDCAWRGVDPGEQVGDADGDAVLSAGVALDGADGPGAALTAVPSAEPPRGCALPGASGRISAPVLEMVRCSWVRA